jgi:hypothetical protein
VGDHGVSIPSPPTIAPVGTVSVGQTRLEPAAGSSAVRTTPTAAASTDPRAHPAASGGWGWLAVNRAELTLIAVMLGGLGVLGFLMSFDLPLVPGVSGP